jgi:hypothetical protein
VARSSDDLEMRDAAQGHHLAVARADKDFVERARVALEFRIRFEHDAILVLRPVHDRNLTLAKRTIEGRINCIGSNTESASCIAVDDDVSLQALELLVAINVSKLRGFLQLLDKTRRPGIQLIQIDAAERVLIKGLCGASSDTDVLHRLKHE